MREYSVRILDIVFVDIDDIADFIIKVSTAEHAARYAQELGAEIMSLRYLADIIRESRYRTIKRYHPHAKQLRTRNKKMNYRRQYGDCGQNIGCKNDYRLR